jgi:hypothetical protein
VDRSPLAVHHLAMANGVTDRLERLGARALPYAELHAEITERLRKVMRIDAACWHGLDPANLLLTTANPFELLNNGFLTPETEMVAAGAVLASEYQRADVNSFASLAKRRRPSAILSETTRGHPEQSARYNDFLAPFGLPYEMRTAMVTRGRAWGCVIFHRTAASGDFTQEDAALMGKLSRPIAEALRNTLRFDAARRAGPRAPSMLVLGPTDDIELATPGTDEVLELLRYADPVARTLPAPVLILAAQIRAGSKDGRPPEPLHTATAEGWITLHGSLPSERARCDRVSDHAGGAGCSAAAGDVRAQCARARSSRARREWARHHSDRRSAIHLALDGPGPLQGDLREDRHAQSARTSRAGLLPRPPARHRIENTARLCWPS